MSTLHALRTASRVYASFSGLPFSGLRLASSGIGSHGLSQARTSTHASTSKLSHQKPALRKVAPENFLSESVASRIMSSRSAALDKRISPLEPVPNPDSKPASKATATEPSYPPRPGSRPPPTPIQYKSHRERIKKKFPEGWAPPRTISREAMEVLRALHAEDPVRYRTPVLANKFKISPEAVSRILRSKWRPSEKRIAQSIARDNMIRDKRIAEKIRAERAQVAKSLEGRLDIVERAQGKDKLTLK